MQKNSHSDYDEDYFEHGVSKGVSGYMHYRWMPEMTLRMVHHMIQKLGLKPTEKILDFGCAKGFLVHAMRILDIPCFGVDISGYAIKKSPQEVQGFCRQITDVADLASDDNSYKWVIAKDVLEHLTIAEIDSFLETTAKISKKLFIAVPLGKDDTSGDFVIPSYNLDKTHITIKTFNWWVAKFEAFGWRLDEAKYTFPGMKENWIDVDAQGNGFFILSNPQA